MGLSRAMLCPSRCPFHSIVPGAVANPASQITLPVTFGTRGNFRTENLQFEVTNFEMAYNAFLGRSTLSKFMAIPHYAYMVLKMPGLHGVISIMGDAKRSYDCDRESCKMADKLMASTVLQDMNRAFPEPPQTRSCPRSRRPSSWRTSSAKLSCCPRRSLPRLLT
jgi:hypothetical protein